MIPEKWSLKLTKESIPILLEWLNKEFENNLYNKDNIIGTKYFDFPNRSTYNGFQQGYHLNFLVESNYTEISLEEFKQYIYKAEGSIVENFQIY